MQARGEAPASFTVDVNVNGQAVGSQTFTPESWSIADPIVVRAPAVAGTDGNASHEYKSKDTKTVEETPC
jgi:hypothetical protein